MANSSMMDPLNSTRMNSTMAYGRHACVVCKNVFSDDFTKLSIFEKDSLTKKCLAYKIFLITGEDLIFNQERGFICMSCHGLLMKIHLLEQDFIEIFKGNIMNQTTMMQGDTTRPTFDDTYANMTQNADQTMVQMVDPRMVQTMDQSQILMPGQNRPGGPPQRMSSTPIKNHPPDQNANVTQKLLTCKKPGCEKTYFRKWDLNIHERNHPEIKFECNQCSEVFFEKEHLTVHEVNVHTRKEFSCEFCEESFVTKTGLIKHRELHTGEKSFSCITCSKMFLSTADLKIHEKSHRNLKPHACTRCIKTYATKQQLKAHLERHDRPVEYKCSQCGAIFDERRKLTEHIWEEKRNGVRPY